MNTDLNTSDVLASGGILARRLQGFRERPQQLSMAQEVGATFRAGGQLVLEAPTGVGKSYAYLVPAILDVIARGKRVIVSTHTIALQDQLLRKDVPLLADCLPVEFTAVKAMGRNNYLSRRRLAVALQHAPTLLRDDADVKRLRALEDWAADAGEGTLQELGRHPGAVWELARSEGDNCLARHCPTFESCFFHQARRLDKPGVSIDPDCEIEVRGKLHVVRDVADLLLKVRLFLPAVDQLGRGLILLPLLAAALHHGGEFIHLGCQLANARRLLGQVAFQERLGLRTAEQLRRCAVCDAVKRGLDELQFVEIAPQRLQVVPIVGQHPIDDRADERLGHIDHVGQRSEGDLRLDHPELGEVTASLALFGAERGTEAVDLAMTHASRFEV